MSAADELQAQLVSLEGCRSSALDPSRDLVVSVGKNLAEIRETLAVAVDEKDVVKHEKAMVLSRRIQELSLIRSLIFSLPALPSDAQRDVPAIVSALLTRDWAQFQDHMEGEMEGAMAALVGAYRHTEASLACGALIRECMRHERLAGRILARPESVWPFFDIYVHLPQFAVASDAFATVRQLLTAPASKEFILANLDVFLAKCDALLQSENFVTKLSALRLVTELLLDRSHHRMMMRFVSSKDHLKTIMNLLKQKSAQIQFESFNVFKIFVANPHKSAEVASILFANRDKIVAFLRTFQEERDDPLFRDEKAGAIEELERMENPRPQLRKQTSANSYESGSEPSSPSMHVSAVGDLITASAGSRGDSLQIVVAALEDLTMASPKRPSAAPAPSPPAPSPSG